jgi:prepilin-type N-terminal cleavage/methylation domain-containing protein/prepilin-type processing-associated H-X9-DG protein
MRFRPIKPGRRGFTLIELLVVIAIIAILIGLLVPAVQKVREAAARSQCQNNLKQMALAFHMYQDTFKQLPAGWVTSTASHPNPGWSWSLLILPFIEQGPLYKRIGPNVATPGGPPAANALLQNPVPVFLCPSDGSPNINGNFHNYGKINYVVNRWVTGPNSSSNPTRMTIQTIRDGSSNTLLIGERDMTINVGGAALVRDSASTASFEGRMGSGINPQPAPGSHWTTTNNQRLAYSSLHTGGCNFAFADGSIHFISNTVPCDPLDNWGNFPTLGTNWANYTGQRLEVPNDGLPVSLPDL